MKLNKMNNALIRLLSCCLLTALLSESCRKEKMPAPSDLDENYFVLKDNPNDPADHAMYEFYKSTGIASFYNDTIHQRYVGDTNGKPRYAYITLSLEYTFYSSTQSLFFKRVSNKAFIPELMSLMEQKLLPGLPSGLRIPSLLLVDSVWTLPTSQNVQIADGWTSFPGFNTIAICVKDVAAMNSDERRMYAASLKAGITEKYLNILQADKLQDAFFSITRTAAKNILPVDIYTKTPFISFYPPGMEPSANSIGILKYPRIHLAPIPPLMNLPVAPSESDDLRAFLTAAFYYTEQEFDGMYPDKALLLKKFGVIREILLDAGFMLPN